MAAMGKKDALFVLLIVLAVWGLYFHTLPYELIWDSVPLVRDNQLLQRSYPVTAAFTHGYWEMTGEKMSSHDYYRPLVTLSLMVEKRIWGLDKARLKAANLAIFSLGAAGAVRVFQTPGRTGRFRRHGHGDLRPLSAAPGQHRLGRRPRGSAAAALVHDQPAAAGSGDREEQAVPVARVVSGRAGGTFFQGSLPLPPPVPFAL